MNEYKRIAISCKAKNLLEEIIKLNPKFKKFEFVSELIEDYYNNMKGAK